MLRGVACLALASQGMIFFSIILKGYWLRDKKKREKKEQSRLLSDLVKRTVGEIEARGGGPVNNRLG